MKVTHLNHDTGVTLECQYERASWGAYLLKAWRISFEDSTTGELSVGEWHKIHGNQRKDIGSAKLILDTIPTPNRCRIVEIG